MGTRGVWLFTLVALLAAVALAEVTILKSVQYMYDRSPKLRIRGDGFENVDEHDILLEISATGQPSLRMDKDYLLSKDPDGDGIILKLLSARRCVVVPILLLCAFPTLFLSTVFFHAREKVLLTHPTTQHNTTHMIDG